MPAGRLLMLRLRVALFMALGVALALGLQGLLGYLTFTRLVTWDLDKDLLAFTQVTAQRLRQAPNLTGLRPEFEGYTVHARLLDGQRVTHNLTGFPTAIPRTPAAEQIYTSGAWRVTLTPVTWQGRPLTLQTALTSQEFTKALHDYLIAMLITASAVTLIGAWAAYLLSGYALRPLRSLTELCSRVAQSGQLQPPILTPGAAHGEIRDLAVAFNEMLQRLHDFRSREARFNRQASHELRTPLTAMRLSLDAARSGYSDPLETLDALDQELRRAQRLTGALLILSREGRLARTEPVNVARLARECAAQRQAEYSGPLDALVSGDETLIRRAVENLLENAALHAPHANVTVCVQLLEDGTQLSVQDSGPGLPPEVLKRVTEEFYHFTPAVQSQAGATAGAGLGLSVVAHVMNAHGGQVTFQNARPHGLLVTLTFPEHAANGE